MSAGSNRSMSEAFAQSCLRADETLPHDHLSVTEPSADEQLRVDRPVPHDEASRREALADKSLRANEPAPHDHTTAARALALEDAPADQSAPQDDATLPEKDLRAEKLFPGDDASPRACIRQEACPGESVPRRDAVPSKLLTSEEVLICEEPRADEILPGDEGAVPKALGPQGARPSEALVGADGAMKPLALEADGQE